MHCERCQNPPGKIPPPVVGAQPCGLGRRLLVMAYDAIALIALMMAVTAILLLTPLRNQTAFLDPMPTLVLLVTWFLYLGWCWRRGLTLGMRAWRVRLVFDSEPGWWPLRDTVFGLTGFSGLRRAGICVEPF